MQEPLPFSACAVVWGAMLAAAVAPLAGAGETVDSHAAAATEVSSAEGARGVRRHRCARCAALAAAGSRELGGAGAAGVDPRINPMTGEDKRVWPPDRPFDHLHMRLELTVPDMAADRFTARQTLTVTPRGTSRRALELNAGRGLRVKAVMVDGQDASFTHEEEVLRVVLPREVGLDEVAAVVIDYETTEPGGGGGGGAGLTWSEDDPETEVFDPMFHAQGQAESNRFWFPCHDFPNERLTTELIVTVPTGFTAISNGRLAGEEPAEGASRFHWVQEKSHVPYLVTLVIGVFDRVDVGEAVAAAAMTRTGLPMPVYGPVGSAEKLQKQFADTAAMVAHFEERFDEPYPWAKYAQIYVRDFAAGAMENTSATTFNISYLDDPEDDWSLQSIIAHELAHQWFGDLVTCRSWEHLWLNEGWASFCEAVWAEQNAKLEGKTDAEAREAYMDVIRDYARSELALSRLGVPDHQPMANNLYREADDRFGEPNNVYSKGCLTLHMLRENLGDELFWKGARLYLDRHQYGLVETNDFRRAMEDATGRSLEQFFAQWVHRPSHPCLTVDLVWRPAGVNDSPEAAEDVDEFAAPGGGELRAMIMQTQAIDGNNPAFAFELPLHIELPESAAVASADDPASAPSHTWRIHVNERMTMVTLPLAARPETVRVNPNFGVLAQIRVTGDWPEERWRRPRPDREDEADPAEEAESQEEAPAGG